MVDKIKHLGIVESINGPYVRVRVLQKSACSACSAKGSCHASEAQEKYFDVYNSEGVKYEVGQQVVCCITTSLGMKAILIAFVIPFILMFVVLFVSMYLTHEDEMLSAILALCALIPYYIIIYFMRNAIRRSFSFTLETLNN